MASIYNFVPPLARFLRLLAGLYLLGLLAAPGAMAQTIRYVKPAATGTGTGASWANASGNFQAMITASTANDQVWVAAGTYKPTTTNNRSISFSMKVGVAIYGGFVGTETLLSQRPAISLTVPPSTTLSANIANDLNNTSYNIFANGPGLTNSAILDGFVLSFALANNSATYPQYAGGAISNNGTNSGNVCSPTIRNCWFTNNLALIGGAIYNGGGNFGNSSPVISNCRFENNQRAFGSNVTPFGGQSGGGGIMNDAATSGTSNPVISNCLFRNNNAPIGGGIFNNAIFSGVASPTIVNCVFQGNTTSLPSSAGGSAIYNGAFNSSTSNPTITGCSFLGNTALLYGGAIVNAASGTGSSVSSPILTNCSFQNNTAPLGGGAVYNSVGTGGTAAPKLINCVSFGNGEAFKNNAVAATITLTYSLYEPSSVTGTGIDTGGAGNLTTTVTPFLNTTSNELGNCSPAVNAGLNSTPKLVGVTTDVIGNPRIANGTVDMGAHESVLNLVAGTIGGPPIVPFPQESANTLTSLTAASAAATPITLKWQQSGDNGAFWTDIPSSNAQSIALPTPLTTDGNGNKLYQFRRIVTDACSRTATAAVTVNVIRADGRFIGKVVSGDGITPVAGVTITAVRTTTGLAGSPGSWTYTAVTGPDGTYVIAPIYYGVQAGTTPPALTAATFTVTPTYTDPNAATLVHVFNPTTQTFTLNQFNSPKTFDFTDNTTFGINGQTRQVCPDCITGFSGQTPLTGSVTCPVDGVSIRTFRSGTQINLAQTGYLALPNPANYGRFAVAVNNPGSYSLTAAFTNLIFVPGGQAVNVVSNVYNVNFDSPTSQTIVGRVAAGCGEAIGSAVLEFTDVLKDGNGADRPACFRKQVTTSPTGHYTIVLPPRKYKVTVISLTPNGTAGVSSPDFVAFINNQFPIDSLTRDLTSATAVTTLNLTYQRPPSLLISGLAAPPVCGTAAGYSLMQQGNPVTLTVSVYQGPVATGCLVSSGTLLVSTNTQVDSGENCTTTVSGTTTLASGIRSLTIVPGMPNIIAPYYRFLNVQFTDAFGRAATPQNRNIVVTGVQAGTATFETVSPQIPLLVLHDPPGDLSFSSWQQSTTQQSAMRFSYDLGMSVRNWFEAKVGVAFSLGFIFSTETRIFGTIGGNITTSGRVVNSSETILTNTITEFRATRGDNVLVGDDADVFYGAALNMYYAISTVIAYDPASCSVTSSKRLIVGNKGVSTNFSYSAFEIKNSVIPSLQGLSDLSTDPSEKKRYSNQINVWQQVLANNEKNKAEAPFITNRSFDGGTGGDTFTEMKSISKSNTIEFGLTIDTEVAVALGFEIAGNGVSGGTSVNFKADVGSSNTNTNITETTTSYTLRDSNLGDRISVDVKTDPIYGTPVFKLMGGKSSCPPEVGALPRDAFQLTAPITVIRDVAPGSEAQFTLRIGNISQVISDASRPVYLALVAGSNPDGALINGNPYTGPIGPLTVGRLSEILVTIRVGKSASSNVYAYEGLQFQLLDGCSGGGSNVLATINLAAYFQSPCSNIVLTTPGDNLVSTLADNNSLPVLMTGYTLANLSNVTLQYRPKGGTNWSDAFTLSQAQLNNSVNGTQANWNTAGLADGAYVLRLKLNCPLGSGAVGTVYSQQANGVFDRTAPIPFGNTQPASDTYSAGSTIGINFNEPLNCAVINSSNILAKRVSNGQVVPVSVGCFQNQISVVPSGNLTPFAGDIISLTLTGVADQYGNPRTTPDTWSFRVGNTAPSSGTNALSVSISGSPISESSTGAMLVTFSLPTPVATGKSVLVNFGVAGTASFPADFSTAYAQPATQPLSATVNGTSGQILIPEGVSSAVLLLRPINDSFPEPDETIIFSLLAGGDYQISAASSVTGVILNDDAPCAGGAVTTVKAGNWNDPTVWSCGAVPVLTDVVQINHAVILGTNYVAQARTVRYGAGGRMSHLTGGRLQLGF